MPPRSQPLPTSSAEAAFAPPLGLDTPDFNLAADPLAAEADLAQAPDFTPDADIENVTFMQRARDLGDRAVSYAQNGLEHVQDVVDRASDYVADKVSTVSYNPVRSRTLAGALSVATLAASAAPAVAQEGQPNQDSNTPAEGTSSNPSDQTGQNFTFSGLNNEQDQQQVAAECKDINDIKAANVIPSDPLKAVMAQQECSAAEFKATHPMPPWTDRGNPTQEDLDYSVGSIEENFVDPKPFAIAKQVVAIRRNMKSAKVTYYTAPSGSNMLLTYGWNTVTDPSHSSPEREIVGYTGGYFRARSATVSVKAEQPSGKWRTIVKSTKLPIQEDSFADVVKPDSFSFEKPKKNVLNDLPLPGLTTQDLKRGVKIITRQTSVDRDDGNKKVQAQTINLKTKRVGTASFK